MIQGLLLALAASVVSAQAPRAPSPAPDSAGTVAVVDVTVVPMDRERTLPRHTVVVRDGRIVAVGPTRSTRVPAGAVRIDGRGRFLMPGLADMHSHLAPGEGTPADGAGRQMRLFLANGITTVRGVIAPPGYLAFRDRVRSGEVLGPMLLVAGPSLNGNSVKTPADGRRMVEEAKAAGYDLLKTHGGFASREIYDTIAAAAKRAGLLLGGHVSAETGLAGALASGQQVEHLDGYIAATIRDGADASAAAGQIVTDPAVLAQVDTAKLRTVAEATRRAGVWNGPTLALFENIVGSLPVDSLAARPEMQYVPAQGLANWRNQVGQIRQSEGGAGAEAYLDLRRRLVRALHAGGARLLVSSDSPQLFLVAGFGTHREMRAMADAGLPAYAVLEAATRGPAEYLGQAQEFGTVAVGRRADLLLLDADPLADVGNTSRIAGVMTRGRWLPRAELARMLAEAKRGLSN
jgi:hypothetical protein